MSTRSRQTIYGSRIRGAKIHADNARLAARKAVREADRAEAERAGPAIADDRAMPQWRAWLARGRVQPLQDPREPAARCHPPAARYADLETGSGAEMPVMPEGPLRAAGAHDQADGDARDHALSLGASGRGAVRGSGAKQCVSCPGRGAAFFTMHRRAGTQGDAGAQWTPDQQRTASRCAASGARIPHLGRGKDAWQPRFRPRWPRDSAPTPRRHRPRIWRRKTGQRHRMRGEPVRSARRLPPAKPIQGKQQQRNPSVTTFLKIPRLSEIKPRDHPGSIGEHAFERAQ